MIIYTGTLIKKEREPNHFFEVFRKFENRNIKLKIIGSNNCPEIIEYYKKLCPSGALEICGAVPHNEVVGMLSDADIFLNIGNKSPNMVPSKIFEYISHGKPLISLYSTNEDQTISYLKKYPLALLLDERDKNYIKQAEITESFIMESIDIRLDFNGIRDLFFDSTPESFIRAISDLQT